VVDTHLLAGYGKAADRKESDASARLVEAIITVCSHVVWSKRQMKEALPQFRRAGYRLPQSESPILGLLDAANKLKVVARSKTRPLPPAAARLFRGNLSDDMHLYMTAKAVPDAVVITEDSGLIDSRNEIEKMTGIQTFNVAEAIGS